MIEKEGEFSEAASTMDDSVSNDLPKVKRRKPGIIYLSSIPQNMNVAKIETYFTTYGKIGKIFLQPIKNSKFFIFNLIFLFKF